MNHLEQYEGIQIYDIAKGGIAMKKELKIAIIVIIVAIAIILLYMLSMNKKILLQKNLLSFHRNWDITLQE